MKALQRLGLMSAALGVFLTLPVAKEKTEHIPTTDDKDRLEKARLKRERKCNSRLENGNLK